MTGENEKEVIKEKVQVSSKVRTMTRVALVAAVFCVVGPLAIPVPISPVPISLTNFAIFLSVFVLEWKQALVSCLLYLLIGLVGLPVFSGFTGGVAKFAGPTGGYLIGFIPLVLIAGLFLKLSKGRRWQLYYVTGVIIGEVLMYIIGTAWLATVLSVSFTEGLFIGVIPYLPGDGVKLVIAVIVGGVLRKRLHFTRESP